MVRTRRSKREIYDQVLHCLTTTAPCDDSISAPSFPQQLWAHFDRLSSRYAFDVHSNAAEDVLIHMKLLQQVYDPASRPAFEIRAVQVVNDQFIPEVGPSNNEIVFQRPMHEIIFSSEDRPKLLSQLTTLLAELDLNIQEAHAYSTSDGYSLIIVVVNGWPYQENDLLRVTLQKQIDMSKSKAWTVAQPLLPKVETVGEEKLASCSISIPTDGTDDWEIDSKLLTFDNKLASGSYGDLFRGTYCSQEVAIKVLKPEVVSPDMLREFAQEIYIMRKVRHKNVVQFIGACTKPPVLCIVTAMNGPLPCVSNCNDITAVRDTWQQPITDITHFKPTKVYWTPAAAKGNRLDTHFLSLHTEKLTVPRSAEFMRGGSLFDVIHNLGGIFHLQAVVRIAIDVSKGMDYLHQCDIIHRDLKTANLLMDENQVVKVADFGVARVKDHSGVMTAETGTYRWMAPEVIEHKPYDHKADVFSFGIVLWELLVGKLPYEDLTPLQAAVAVVQKGLRPTIPEGTHPKLTELLVKCWQYDPSLRPNFSDILDILYCISKEVTPMGDQKKSAGGGFLSAFLHMK